MHPAVLLHRNQRKVKNMSHHELFDKYYALTSLASKVALSELIGTEEMLDKATSLRHIIAVYECADNNKLRQLAIKKLDTNIDCWFEDINDEYLVYLLTNAPNGSKTKERAEEIHSARLGHY